MFSKATEYALRATIFIAQNSTPERKIGIDEIAKGIDAPRYFTAKILQALRKNNAIIHSVSGPNGGFYMDERVRELPVRAILVTMGEDELFDKCVLGLTRCSEIKPCPMHFKYKPIKAQLKELFESKTIQHLADEIKDGTGFINNE